MVSPSRTRIWVVASRLSILGPAGLLRAPTALRVALTFIMICFPSSLGSREVIWGVTCSSRLASTKVVWVPCSEVVWNGMDSPCEILASRLSSVVILGAAMTLLRPSSSPAESRMSRKAPSPPGMSLPNVKPAAGTAVKPVTAAGRLTRKFPVWAPNASALPA